MSTKKTKLYNSRAIRTELADPAVAAGVLSVPQFLRARQFEIRSFEMSQLNTKYAAATRVFQKLPRVLRRRAASHNVKRVPRRLRRRAVREMAAEPKAPARASGKSVYQAKMRARLLRLAARLKAMGQLPADAVFDAASAQNRIRQVALQLKQLTESRSPRILNNVLGSYDATGVNALAARPRGGLKYYKRQTHYVWLPTHVWHAKRCHMVKRWGYQIPLSPTQKCFRAVNRASKQETVLFDTSYFGCVIVDCFGDDLATIYRRVVGKSPAGRFLSGQKTRETAVYVGDECLGPAMVYCNAGTSQLLFRAHPSIYHRLFSHLLEIKHDKSVVQDCRYSLASLELAGPKSLNSLSKVFHLAEKNELWVNAAQFSEQNIPVGTSFSFHVKDPRLYGKPVSPPVKNPKAHNDLLIELSTGLTVDDTISKLLRAQSRSDSYSDQLTNKVLHKIVGNRTLVDANTTQIPVLVTKLPHSWCVVVPWFWLLPIWLQLTKIKCIKLGGLRQKKQINFENFTRTFPDDYPYLKEGWIHNELTTKINSDFYRSLPSSKRIPYEKFEIDSPFGCDWEFLRNYSVLKTQYPNLKPDPQFGEFDGVAKTIRTEKDLAETSTSLKTGDLAVTIGDTPCQSVSDKLPLKMIWIELESGNVKDFARVYDVNSNLIGYVVSGGINLNTGKATALSYITTAAAAAAAHEKILVRNVGASSVLQGKIMQKKIEQQ